MSNIQSKPPFGRQIPGPDPLSYNYCNSFLLKLEPNSRFLEPLNIFGVKLFNCIKEIKHLDLIKCLMSLIQKSGGHITLLISLKGDVVQASENLTCLIIRVSVLVSVGQFIHLSLYKLLIYLIFSHKAKKVKYITFYVLP